MYTVYHHSVSFCSLNSTTIGGINPALPFCLSHLDSQRKPPWCTMQPVRCIQRGLESVAWNKETQGVGTRGTCRTLEIVVIEIEGRSGRSSEARHTCEVIIFKHILAYLCWMILANGLQLWSWTSIPAPKELQLLGSFASNCAKLLDVPDWAIW